MRHTAETTNAGLRMRETRPRTVLWVSAIRPTVNECGFDGGEIPTTDCTANGSEPCAITDNGHAARLTCSSLPHAKVSPSEAALTYDKTAYASRASGLTTSKSVTYGWSAKNYIVHGISVFKAVCLIS